MGHGLAEPVGSRSGRASGATVWQSQLPLEDTRCPSGQDPTLLDQVQLYLVDQVQREWATGLSEAQVLDLVQYMKLDQVQLHLMDLGSGRYWRSWRFYHLDLPYQGCFMDGARQVGFTMKKTAILSA